VEGSFGRGYISLRTVKLEEEKEEEETVLK
jgi:hypothetical protein